MGGDVGSRPPEILSICQDFLQKVGEFSSFQEVAYKTRRVGNVSETLDIHQEEMFFPGKIT